MTLIEVRNFVGSDGYYRRFIEIFSSLSVSFMNLTQKAINFQCELRLASIVSKS